MAVPTVLGGFALFWVGRAVGRRAASARVRVALLAVALPLAVPGLLYVLYYAHLFDGAVSFYRFRSLPLTELAACGLGFGAGVGAAWLKSRAAAHVVIPAALLLLLLIPFAKPILSPIVVAGRGDAPRPDGVVLQSTFSTCGPASAATLLGALGHPASEQELAREAFTSRGGTENWYLARALRRRGFDVAFQVLPDDGGLLPSPAIAGVILPGGAGHFIAVLASTAEDVTLVDPLSGKHTIRRSDLKQRYRFTGFFMVVRPGPGRPT